MLTSHHHNMSFPSQRLPPPPVPPPLPPSVPFYIQRLSRLPSRLSSRLQYLRWGRLQSQLAGRLGSRLASGRWDGINGRALQWNFKLTSKSTWLIAIQMNRDVTGWFHYMARNTGFGNRMKPLNDVSRNESRLVDAMMNSNRINRQRSQ